MIFVWKIIYGRLLNLKRSYKVYIFMLTLPLIFTFVFGAAVGGDDLRIPVPVVDLDDSEYSRMLIEELKGLDAYAINLTDKEELQRLVSENASQVGLIIPDGFQEAVDKGIIPRLDLVITAQTSTLYSFEGVLRSSIQKMSFNVSIARSTVDALSKHLVMDDDRTERIKNRVYELASEKWVEALPLKVNARIDTSNKDNVSFNMYTQTSLGFTLAFSMFTFIFAIGEILEEKKNMIWDRINISPLSKFQIYTGNLIYACAIGVIQMLIMAFVGQTVFRVNWGANIGGVLAILAAFTFCMVSLGLLMSSFVRTNQQLQVTAPVIVVSASMIGGCYWPLEMVNSKILFMASKFVPPGWAMKGLKDLIVYNQGFDAVYLPVAVLILMGVIFMGTALQVSEKIV